MIINVIYLVVISVYSICTHDTSFAVMEKSLKLELLQVNFRHGMRTPSKTEAGYVNVSDPEVYAPYGFEQLTNEGNYQLYKLGMLLRKKYDKFLGNHETDHLYGYSSVFARTKASLQLVLAGLYPPLEEKDKWHPTLNWRPIAFESAKSRADLLTTPHQYKRYNEIFLKELERSEEHQNFLVEYDEFFNFMQKMTGVSYKPMTLYLAANTYYAIKIHKIMKLPLPDWCNDEEVVNKLHNLLMHFFNAMSMTTKLKRMNGGTMVRQVIENIETNRKAEKPRKIYLYSHHDSTLAAFEKALNLKVFDIPPFGSAIILEKYRRDDGVEFVRFLAWNGEDDDFYPVKLDGCEEFCPYKDYRQLVEDVIPTDKELEYLVSGE